MVSGAYWQRIRIIGNPNSGMLGGLTTNRATVADAVAALAECGVVGEVAVTDSATEAAMSAREAVRSGCDLVVAAGGDGTVGTVAQELLGSETALGIMPLGSVMNLARSLELPRDLEAAAAIIAEGTSRRIDIGEARGRVFFESGSVGMNAAIFREANRIDQGDWLGLLSSLRVALRYRPSRMTITLDDRTLRTRAYLITISNGPYTGLGFTVAPSARLDDGLFDVRIFRGFTRWELFKYFAAIAFGRRRYSPKIMTVRSAAVTVASVRPLAARADAHDLGTTPIRFAARHRALRVIVPSRSPARAAPSSCLLL